MISANHFSSSNASWKSALKSKLPSKTTFEREDRITLNSRIYTPCGNAQGYKKTNTKLFGFFRNY